MSQHASNYRARLQVEHLEDRCTPSALLGDPFADFAVDRGGPQAAHFVSRQGVHHQAFPIKVVEQCSADLSTSTAAALGFATHLGHWTGQGHVDSVNVDPASDRGTVSGTLTVVTA